MPDFRVATKLDNNNSYSVDFEAMIEGKIAINAGCGECKIYGCINVDVEPSCNPDEVADFRNRTRWADNSVDYIFFIHVIEHIEAKWHFPILTEFRRILKPEGFLIVAYPEFREIAMGYIENKRGMKQFFKDTVYGLQRYPSDFHVALMDTVDFKDLLENVGFRDIQVRPESKWEYYNTVVRATKGTPKMLYEDVLREEIFDGN